MGRRAGGHPGQHPLGTGQLPGGGIGLVAGDGHHLVHHPHVQGAGDEARADALDLMGPRPAAGEDGGLSRLHRHHADGGVLLLQIAARASDGAAGTHSRHQHVHAAVGVPPQLGTGGLVVGPGVGGVVELVGHPRAWGALQQLLRPLNGAAHTPGPFGEHQLRPQSGQQAAPLLTHGLRHGEHHPVAPLAADVGQGHAGVAAGGLHNHRAGLEQAPLLGVQNHVKACPVLGGGQGVKALQLGQHPCPGGKPLQPKQGGVPDQLGQCICNLHR